MLPQTMPSDIQEALEDVGSEIVYVGLQLSGGEYNLDDLLANLRSLARRLENLNVARIMSTVENWHWPEMMRN